MKAQLEQTPDAAREAEVLREALVAEDALQRREDYLRLTIDTIPVLAWCTAPDGSNEFLNQRWLDYTGLTIEEARGWGWKVEIHPDDRPQLLDVWQGLLASGKSGELEARLRRTDGVYRWFLFRVEPLRDAQGTIVKWYGTNTAHDHREIRCAQCKRVGSRAGRRLISHRFGIKPTQHRKSNNMITTQKQMLENLMERSHSSPTARAG